MINIQYSKNLQKIKNSKIWIKLKINIYAIGDVIKVSIKDAEYICKLINSFI